MKTLFKCSLLPLIIITSGCGADPSIMEGNESSNHNSSTYAQGQGVEISSAYIKPPFKGRTTSAAFFTVQNKGEDTRLISASTPIAERTEIHTHLEEDGIMKMRRVEGVDFPNGQTVEFKPGGYHLMMFNTTLEDGQTDAALTLTYENGKEVTLIVPIEGGESSSGMKKPSDHSGH